MGGEASYLRHVLNRIAEHPINRIDELLPWAVAGQINAAMAQQRLAARAGCAIGTISVMADPKLIEALSNASSLELFELSNIVDRLLADPRRIMAIRRRLNPGKAVQFMDWRTGQMRSGKVVELKSNQVTVHEDGTRTHWKLSYAGIDPGGSDERIDSPSPSVNQAPVHKPGPEDFRRGDKVSFSDKYLQHQVGTITRINQRTATVDCEGGAGWRVPFAMLRHVMDI